MVVSGQEFYYFYIVESEIVDLGLYACSYLRVIEFMPELNFHEATLSNKTNIADNDDLKSDVEHSGGTVWSR